MYYEGSYTPKVLPELKVALGETYRAKKFCGGRGLSRTFPDKELSYINDVRGDFTEFSGTEHILGITEPDGGESTLGTHTYRGGVMISNLRET